MIVATGVPATNKTQNVIVNFTVNSSLPTITLLWPNPVQANTGAVTLWITGANFYSGTTVKANNTSLTPTLLSPTQIQVVVPAGLLTVPGTNVAIVVTNPLGGGSSAAAPLNVSNAPAIQAVLNAASYAAENVSPGEIVALFGQGIGPPNPVYMTISNGYVNQNVGGLLVIVGSNVNGYQSAPLLYADPNQVTVQIPYGVQPGAGQTIQISNGTVVANLPTGSTITVGVNAPGIFTADGSGIGQAAAEVYSGATGLYTGLNSASNPTTATDTVVLYLTGEGEYLTPSGAHTGYIIPPPTPPATLPPQMPAAIAPTVTIGGVSCARRLCRRCRRVHHRIAANKCDRALRNHAGKLARCRNVPGHRQHHPSRRYSHDQVNSADEVTQTGATMGYSEATFHSRSHRCPVVGSIP